LRQIINIVESLQEKISGCGCEAAGTTGKNIAEQGNPQLIFNENKLGLRENGSIVFKFNEKHIYYIAWFP